MRFGAVAILATILAIGTSFSTQAQGGGYAPPGSYQQSCIDISFNSSTQTLTATCYTDKTEKGFSDPNTLVVSTCAPGADIESIQGYLQCNAPAGTWGNGSAVPKGSYQQSCINWQVSTRTLTALCWNFTAGKIDWRPFTNPGFFSVPNFGSVTVASLDLSQCSMSSGDIENIRGELLCTVPASHAPANPPSTNQHAAGRNAPGTPAPGTCKPGFTWREAVPADHVCVTPSTRQQTANDNASARLHTNTERAVPQGQGQPCQPGYVWRQAFASDFVCVVPQSRAQAAADNTAGPSRTY